MFLVEPPSMRLTLLLATGILLSCHGANASHPILQELFDDPSYDSSMWPTFGKHRPTNTTINIFVNSIGSISAANMEFSVDMFLRQKWVDDRLKYQMQNGEKSLVVTNKNFENVWTPDTYFRNVKDATFHQITKPNRFLRIKPDGEMLLSMRLTLKLSCQMNLANYPFDTQVCLMELASYSYLDSQVKLLWNRENGGTGVKVKDELQIGQFNLIKAEPDPNECLEVYSTGNFSCLIATFVFQRQNAFHLLQTYVPTILIVAISWVSFWLDPNAIPGRVTLGVTTLLTITTLASGVRANLPPVSYIKAIDIWIGICMMFVFGALLEFTLVNYLARSKQGFSWRSIQCWKQDKPSTSAALTSPEIQPSATNNRYATAKHVDRICRIAFPLSFGILNILYWSVYVWAVPEEQ